MRQLNQKKGIVMMSPVYVSPNDHLGQVVQGLKMHKNILLFPRGGGGGLLPDTSMKLYTIMKKSSQAKTQ